MKNDNPKSDAKVKIFFRIYKLVDMDFFQKTTKN